MNFKESYLIPKDLYHHPTHVPPKRIQSDIPPDVKTKMIDYIDRFGGDLNKFQFTPNINKQEKNDIDEMVDSIQDTSKHPLGREILYFIQSKTGGSISWTKDYKVVINGEIQFDTDMRDCLRMLVGEIPKSGRAINQILLHLLAFKIDPNLLIYIDPKSRPSPTEHIVTDHEADEDEEDEAKAEAQKQKRPELSPMQTRSKKRKLESFSSQPSVSDYEDAPGRKPKSHYMLLRSGKTKLWINYDD